MGWLLTPLAIEASTWAARPQQQPAPPQQQRAQQGPLPSTWAARLLSQVDGASLTSDTWIVGGDGEVTRGGTPSTCDDGGATRAAALMLRCMGRRCQDLPPPLSSLRVANSCHVSAQQQPAVVRGIAHLINGAGVSAGAGSTDLLALLRDALAAAVSRHDENNGETFSGDAHNVDALACVDAMLDEPLPQLLLSRLLSQQQLGAQQHRDAASRAHGRAKQPRMTRKRSREGAMARGRADDTTDTIATWTPASALPACALLLRAALSSGPSKLPPLLNRFESFESSRLF